MFNTKKSFFDVIFGNRKKNKHAYPSRETIHYIKKLGTLPIEKSKANENILVVVQHMKKYPDSISMQRVCCHTISNMSMDTEIANEVVINRKTHLLVVDSLAKYKDDWKLCWFACSAIWNMSRSDIARNEFVPDIVDLLVNVINRHKEKQQVVNTVLGSLSNLSLRYVFKQAIGHAQYIESIMTVIKSNTDSLTVSSTSAGLLANLAVHDPIANMLVQAGGISAIARMLRTKSHKQDILLERNASSALNNCISCSLYFSQTLRHKLIEPLLRLRDTSSDIATVSLASNCLVALGLEDNEITTTHHLTAFHGCLDILQKVVTEKLNVNEQDANGCTMLQHAVDQNHPKIVYWLVMIGANENKFIDHPDCELRVILREAKSRRDFLLNTYSNIIFRSCSMNHPRLNKDICSVIMSYISIHSITQNVSKKIQISQK